MPDGILPVIIGAGGGLVGSLIGASISFWIERSRQRTDRAKFIAELSTVSEVEKSRIQAYISLWSCFDGLSTRRPHEMVVNLPKAQDKLQDWYYLCGGGLLLAGTYRQVGSTKAAFFAARDLRSSDPSEIWRVFHELRRCLRRDLKIYDDDEDEARALREIKEKLKQLES